MTYSVSPADMSVEQLVDKFTQITLAQYEAVKYKRISSYNKLYQAMVVVRNELKSRDGDQRRELMRLYVHSNIQVRLAAARSTLAIAYSEARRVIEAIADSGDFPQAGDAGMCLWNLDRGIFKPT